MMVELSPNVGAKLAELMRKHGIQYREMCFEDAIMALLEKVGA